MNKAIESEQKKLRDYDDPLQSLNANYVEYSDGLMREMGKPLDFEKLKKEKP